MLICVIFSVKSLIDIYKVLDLFDNYKDQIDTLVIWVARLKNTSNYRDQIKSNPLFYISRVGWSTHRTRFSCLSSRYCLHPLCSIPLHQTSTEGGDYCEWESFSVQFVNSSSISPNKSSEFLLNSHIDPLVLLNPLKQTPSFLAGEIPSQIPIFFSFNSHVYCRNHMYIALLLWLYKPFNNSILVVNSHSIIVCYREDCYIDRSLIWTPFFLYLRLKKANGYCFYAIILVFIW